MKLKIITLMTVIFSFLLVTLSRTVFYWGKVFKNPFSSGVNKENRYNFNVLALFVSLVICMIPSNALPLPEGLWQVIGPESEWDTRGDGTRTWGADTQFGTEELDIHKRTYTIKNVRKGDVIAIVLFDAFNFGTHVSKSSIEVIEGLRQVTQTYKEDQYSSINGVSNVKYHMIYYDILDLNPRLKLNQWGYLGHTGGHVEYNFIYKSKAFPGVAASMEAELNNLKRSVTSLQSTNTQLTQQKQQLETKLNEIAQTLGTDTSTAITKINELKQHLTDKQADLDSVRDSVQEIKTILSQNKSINLPTGNSVADQIDVITKAVQEVERLNQREVKLKPLKQNLTF